MFLRIFKDSNFPQQIWHFWKSELFTLFLTRILDPVLWKCSYGPWDHFRLSAKTHIIWLVFDTSDSSFLRNPRFCFCSDYCTFAKFHHAQGGKGFYFLGFPFRTWRPIPRPRRTGNHDCPSPSSGDGLEWRPRTTHDDEPTTTTPSSHQQGIKYQKLHIFFSFTGLPEGVLTFSNKECLNVGRPSGSPNGPPGGSPSPWGPVSPGWHSDQGSQNPGIVWEFRLWKMIRGKRARLFVENFGARLAGIVIWPDCPLFEKKSRGAWNQLKSTTYTKYMLQNPGACFFWGRRSAAGSDHQTHRAGGFIWSQNSVKGRLWVRIVGQNRVKGIFWVSPIYLLYLMEYFE